MKTSSCKAKGRRLQNEVAMLLADVTGITYETDGEIDVRPMGQAGVDIILRGEAKKKIPFSIECKCQERLNIWKAIEQAEKNGEPLVFIKKNRSKTYVTVEATEENVRRLLG